MTNLKHTSDLEKRLIQGKGIWWEFVFIDDIDASSDNDYTPLELLESFKKTNCELWIDESMMILIFPSEINPFLRNRLKVIFKRYADKLWEFLKDELNKPNKRDKTTDMIQVV